MGGGGGAGAGEGKSKMNMLDLIPVKVYPLSLRQLRVALKNRVQLKSVTEGENRDHITAYHILRK